MQHDLVSHIKAVPANSSMECCTTVLSPVIFKWTLYKEVK
jgi:hypothetical protein